MRFNQVFHSVHAQEITSLYRLIFRRRCNHLACHLKSIKNKIVFQQKNNTETWQ